MSTFESLLDRLRGTRVLVVGDLMLDEYILGRAIRISQEAPVMVIRQHDSKSVPGGAANVAANITALGGATSVVGVVGDDEAGRRLAQALEESGAANSCLVCDPGRPTTRKTRVLADSAHQVLRIDHEERRSINDATLAELWSTVEALIGDQSVVLISDYQKGAVTETLVRSIIESASRKDLPVIANAKPGSLKFYHGATLVSLNRSETAEASGCAELIEGDLSHGELIELTMKLAKQIAAEHGIGHVLVTLGGDGMCTDGFHVPPHKVEVFDEAGAGDTTIATVTMGIAAVGFEPAVFHLAAQTAAAVVQRVGVAVPSPDDLAAIAARPIPD